MMTLDDFLNRLDLYGADLSRWPSTDIKTALAVMQQDRRAKAAFDETAAMEALLRFSDPGLSTAYPVNIENRVMAAIKGQPQMAVPSDISFMQSIRNYVAPALSGLATMAIVGFLVGFPAIFAQTHTDPFQQAAQQAVTEDTDLYTGGLFSS